MEQKRSKIDKGKMENWKWKEKKLQNEERTFFFFFCFSLLKTTEICFGSTQTGIFYREKHFTPGKKSGKMTLPPLKNIPLMSLPWIFVGLNSSLTGGKSDIFRLFWTIQIWQTGIILFWNLAIENQLGVYCQGFKIYQSIMHTMKTCILSEWYIFFFFLTIWCICRYAKGI